MPPGTSFFLFNIFYYQYPSSAPNAPITNEDVKVLPKRPVSEIPNTLHIAFIIAGPIVAPATPPSKAENKPSSITSSIDFPSSVAMAADSII
jgi:hypothetical protein